MVDGDIHASTRSRAVVVGLAALSTWCALVALALPSLAGRVELRLGPQMLPAIGVGVAWLFGLPRLANKLRWKSLLTVAFLCAGSWAVSLALVDGLGGLTSHDQSSNDYLATAARVERPSAFLSGFVDSISDEFGHVASHPPGMVLALWSLRRIGLGGAGWAAALMICGGAAATPAALVAMRELSGENHARIALPFLALAPAAIWIATSADALFAGVSASGLALFTVAAGRRGMRRAVLAMLAGIIFGFSLFLTYGVVLLVFGFVFVSLGRRSMRSLAFAAAGALVVVGTFAVGGFWWLEGLEVSRLRYLAGVSRNRGYLFFLFANLGALGAALGPAGWVGMTRLRSRNVWLLVGGALLAVFVADVSGMSKGEVERIWLPFVPWLMLATYSLGDARDRAKGWLGVQLLFGFALQLALRSPW